MTDSAPKLPHQRPSLSQALSTPTAPPVGGFEQRFDPKDHNASTVTLTSTEILRTEDDYRRTVEDMGSIKIPEGYQVRLVKMRHQTHGWVRNKQGDDATTEPVWWYEFAVEVRSANSAADIEKLARELRKKKPITKKRPDGEAVFHHLAGDLQLGKPDGKGSESIYESTYRSLEAAVENLKRARKAGNRIGLVNLMWVGDCIEGNVSQGGRIYARSDLTLTEQTRVFRSILRDSVEMFLPYVERIEVDVVNGNHDEVQRFQASTGSDGHATEAAVAVNEAWRMNEERYNGVQMFVPGRDETYMTRRIGSSTFTIMHGHQMKRGKTMEWWAGQSLNRQDPHYSDFIVHGHYHTAGMTTKRGRYAFTVPTHEDMSTWWHERTGDLAEKGSLTMVTENGRFRELEIVN